ncbi:WD repeat-containing protein 61 [Caerostris darwini]|uniref:WD repeat-containing protein 61 n=1 Tax=Caerostris darwini TaxID=1538125 RepID=A0AAV4WY16_9ARAC|nr:WD repeat-containing protein 61 [Caerostris darwini]
MAKALLTSSVGLCASAEPEASVNPVVWLTPTDGMALMLYLTFDVKGFSVNIAHDDSIWCAWRKGQHDGIDHIITGGVDDMVKSWKWDDEKLELRHALEGHALGVVSVDVNDEGSIAASSSLDSHIRLWDLHTGQQLKSIDAGPVDAWTVTFSPDTKYIATGSHAAFSPDGKYLASGAIDGIIKVFDISAGKLVHTLEGHAMPIRSLTFSKDSTMLITASDDCHIKIYNVQHANLIGTVSGHGAWVLSVDCCPDNAHFVSSSSDKTVKVWEIASRDVSTHLMNILTKYGVPNTIMVGVESYLFRMTEQ